MISAKKGAQTRNKETMYGALFLLQQVQSFHTGWSSRAVTKGEWVQKP